jgi:ATP-binding cassette subfamily F protein 3
MGQNGSGKSTILNLMQGKLKAQSGNVNIFGNMRVAAAKQTLAPEDGPLTVIEYFQKHAPYITSNIEGSIHKVLHEVNLNIPLDRKISTFSGGQKARLLLAAALIQEPDILLLDEPTNNLDQQGIDHLTELILGTDKTCIVISHDEEFLNSFSDSVLYLDSYSKTIEQYDGNYHNVKQEISNRIKKENQDNARRAKIAQDKKDQANKFANKGGGMRKVAQKMREVAEQMENEMVVVRKEDRSLGHFDIPAQPLSSVILSLNHISVAGMNSSGKSGIIEIPIDTPISLRMGNRLHITGRNGIGKTTLLENIYKSNINGCTIQPDCRIGYYRQDFSVLNFQHTVIESLQEACNGNFAESELRRTAAQFMLTGNIMYQQIYTLSEGQKGLCAFARLFVQEPGLLILDEPTNHINFRHLPSIANALNNYKGALVIVSHY